MEQRGRGGEKARERATWVFHESGTSRLLCFLIPLSAEQQGRGEKRREDDEEGEGFVFSHRREAGGWAEGASLCTSVCVDGFSMRFQALKAR